MIYTYMILFIKSSNDMLPVKRGGSKEKIQQPPIDTFQSTFKHALIIWMLDHKRAIRFWAKMLSFKLHDKFRVRRYFLCHSSDASNVSCHYASISILINSSNLFILWLSTSNLAIFYLGLPILYRFFSNMINFSNNYYLPIYIVVLYSYVH